METYVVRMWLPDRPGALGQVASRIGAVRGEIVGIDILERGSGRAIDELVVELPDGSLQDLLVREVGHVDGVSVEHIRPVARPLHDGRLDALETAVALIEADGRGELLDRLVVHVRRLLGATWAAVVSLECDVVLAGEGRLPVAAWLAAFVSGSASSVQVAAGEAGPDDVVCSPLPEAHLALVVGRDGTPCRARERRQVAALARLVDARYRELGRLHAQMAHPSAPR